MAYTGAQRLRGLSLGHKVLEMQTAHRMAAFLLLDLVILSCEIVWGLRVIRT